MFPIEEIATRSGLTKRAIRYYEEVGLIPPPERSEGGHRMYTEEHIRGLERMVLLRDSLGLSLNEMKEFLDVQREVEALGPHLRTETDPQEKRRDLERVRTLLQHHISLMDAQTAKLQSAKSETLKMIARVDAGLKTLATP